MTATELLPAAPEAFDPSTDIRVERLIAAPVATIWSAWTDPAHLPRWWGPEGFSCRSKEIDIRPGGAWRFTMIGPDGTEFPNRVRFVALIPLERIDYVIDDDGGPFRPFAGRASFTPEAGSTRVVVHSRFDSHATLRMVSEKYGAVEGASSELACLDAYVATI